MRRRLSHLLQSANNLRQAAGILVVTALASNILGLVRNTVIAKNIPLPLQDDFWSAFLLPDLIFNVLIFGAISSAFIPLFRSLLVDGKNDAAWQLAGSFFAKTTAVVATLAGLLFVFMPPLTKLIFPTLPAADAGAVAGLSRILLLQTVLMGWSYIIGGILNARKRFFTYALSPILYNGAMIAGAFIAPAWPGQTVAVLIWSVVIGAALHLMIQLPSALAVGWRWRYLNWRANEFTREIVALMTPRSIALGITSLNTVILAAIARNLMLPGALSIYRLVESFQTAPISIFANAIAVALFPTLTEHAARADWPRFAAALIKAIRFVLFTLIPSTVIFIVLRAQIIRLYIGLSSEISWDDTIRAIEVFGWFAIGIVPAGLVALFARAYYALKNTLLPMYISAFTLVFGVATAYSLAVTTDLDAGALALATTAAALVQFILLYLAYLRLLKRPLPEAAMLRTATRTVWVSLAMGETIWWTLRWIHNFYVATPFGFTTRTVAGLFWQTALALAAGLFVFYWLARLLLREELSWLKYR